MGDDLLTERAAAQVKEVLDRCAELTNDVGTTLVPMIGKWIEALQPIMDMVGAIAPDLQDFEATDVASLIKILEASDAVFNN